MEKTGSIYVKIDNNDKVMAEGILRQLGVTPSSLIQMLYKQVIVTQGIPFDVCLPSEPIATGNMSKEEIMSLVQEGIDSCASGTYSKEEVDKIFADKYGLKRWKNILLNIVNILLKT